MRATINAPYIDRMLVIARDTPDERTIPEKEIPELEWPIVVLGEPGLGKTRLTHEVVRQTGGRRVTADSFTRVNPQNFRLDCERPLIIDGLDEVTASSGSPIHEVLTKLGALEELPSKVLLTCRAADWKPLRRVEKSMMTSAGSRQWFTSGLSRILMWLVFWSPCSARQKPMRFCGAWRRKNLQICSKIRRHSNSLQ